MVKSVLKVASFVVAAGLFVPALADAQAIPRTTSGGSTSSGSSGGGSSSSGGGGGGVSSSSASGGGSGATSGGGGSVSPPPSSGSSGSSGSVIASDSIFGARSRTSSSTTSNRGKNGADARTAPGGIATGTAVGVSTLTGGSSSSRTAPGSLVLPAGMGGADGRDRGNRPITGLATARTGATGNNDLVSFPFFGPWGQWYPWYTGGFGWGAGFYGYSPWSYAGTCWQWGRYGSWFNPYSYCWDPFWGEPGYGSGGGSRAAAKPRETMGSLRLKVSPETAKVYIDNALVGTVDEFNGLNDRLEVEGGRRVLELRAEGYQTLSKEIVVSVGKTQTVRLTMKKK